jgi:ribonuclease VapC
MPKAPPHYGWERKNSGSLGDRACLATALRLGLPAVTADKVWANIADPEVKVVTIR